MDNAARMRVAHAADMKKRGVSDALPKKRKGTTPTDARRRMCDAVKKYTKMLPQTETVLLLVIPNHGNGEPRSEGRITDEEAVAVLEAMNEIIPGRENVQKLLDQYQQKLGE